MKTNYFLHDGDTQSGPFSFEECKSIELTNTFWVWKEGIKDWTHITEIEELANLIPKTPPVFNKLPPAFDKPPVIEKTKSTLPGIKTEEQRSFPKINGFELIGITSGRIKNTLAKNGEDIGNIICGCKTFDDISFVFIVVPIWFNHYRDFFVFTDKGIIFITKTLWGSWKSVFMQYHLIKGITVSKKKKAFVDIFIKEVPLRMSNRNLYNQVLKHKILLSQLTNINIEE
jgi:hypothetical protein